MNFIFEIKIYTATTLTAVAVSLFCQKNLAYDFI